MQLIILLGFVIGNQASATADDDKTQTLLVAAAANFAETARELAAAYNQQREQQQQAALDIQVIAGSSGKLAAQLMQGAPFDLFFSADTANPDRLAAAGLLATDLGYPNRLSYAVGRLALASSNPAIDKPLVELLAGRFNRLAIANPALAPYGEAANDTLSSLGVERKVADKLIQGENVSQTFQFMATGSADLALVALSQVQQYQRQGRRLQTWQVPDTLHQTIWQDAVVIRGDQQQIAGQFLSFVASTNAQAIILANGYGPAASQANASTAAMTALSE